MIPVVEPMFCKPTEGCGKARGAYSNSGKGILVITYTTKSHF